MLNLFLSIKEKLLVKLSDVQLEIQWHDRDRVAAVSECSHHSLHLWPDAGIGEVMDTYIDTKIAGGSKGRLVCTGLVNQEMPLIRYEVGDVGEMAPLEHRCGCGRTLPI